MVLSAIEGFLVVGIGLIEFQIFLRAVWNARTVSESHKKLYVPFCLFCFFGFVRIGYNYQPFPSNSVSSSSSSSSSSSESDSFDRFRGSSIVCFLMKSSTTLWTWSKS